MNKLYLSLIVLLMAAPMCLNAQEPSNSNEPNPIELGQEVKGLGEKIDRMPKISGFVQGMYQMNLDENLDITSNTFRMRRVRMSIDGKLTKKLSYKLQGDWGNSPILVDAYVKAAFCPEFAVQAGQFKTPFTLESPINPVNLEIFDYGEVVQGLGGYKDVCGTGKMGRDIGIMATGSFFPIADRQFNIIDYSIGIFNGYNINTVDNNNHKDIAGRIEIHPMMKAITLTGSIYRGMYLNDIDLTRNRYSFGAQYNDNALVVRAEYVGGETGKAIEGLNEVNETYYTESLYNSNGYYAVAGYWFNFGEEHHTQKLMPVLRYEHFNQDVATGAGTDYYTVGLNYWPVKSLNLKLDYSLIQANEVNTHRAVAILSYKF